MKIVLTLLAIISLTSTTNAQVIIRGTTPASSYVSAWGEYLRGSGDYLRSLGRYQQDREIAERLKVDNWSHRIQTRWLIQDQAKARRELDRDNRKLANEAFRASRASSTSTSYDSVKSIMDNGSLPKPVNSIVVDGVPYRNLSEWRNSEAYKVHQIKKSEEVVIAGIRKLQNERRHREALSYRNWWDRLGTTGQQHYMRQRAAAASTGEPFEEKKFHFDDLEMKLDAHLHILDKIRGHR